ncbi:hypothetical protein JCM10450v2_007194 [Rhodotorula kratochvilovae]
MTGSSRRRQGYRRADGQPWLKYSTHFFPRGIQPFLERALQIPLHETIVTSSLRMAAHAWVEQLMNALSELDWYLYGYEGECAILNQMAADLGMLIAAAAMQGGVLTFEAFEHLLSGSAQDYAKKLRDVGRANMNPILPLFVALANLILNLVPADDDYVAHNQLVSLVHTFRQGAQMEWSKLSVEQRKIAVLGMKGELDRLTETANRRGPAGLLSGDFPSFYDFLGALVREALRRLPART